MITPPKPRILVLIDWFDPAFKAGGPIQSCVNLVTQLHENFDLFVLTSDCDLGEHQRLQGVTADNWQTYIPGVNVHYTSSKFLGFFSLLKLIRDIAPDAIYLNGMFSRYFTVYPLLYSKIGLINIKLIIAPRGMLKKSALEYKAKKKKLFLNLFNSIGFSKSLIFHATDIAEKRDIERLFGEGETHVISNFPGAAIESPVRLEKHQGALSILFVGRIHSIKNLHYLLSILPEIKGSITLSIAGVIEDRAYWQQCQEIIASMPSNISVKFLGEVKHKSLQAVIDKHHIFALPTKGENFGHAIAEALSRGRPVLISDQTPWTELKLANAGWDISLLNKEDFISTMQIAVSWTQYEFDHWCQSALDFFKQKSQFGDLRELYKKLFN